MSASYRRSGLAGSAVISLALLSSPSLAENVRVAFIDPLSGTFAALGQNELQSFQAIAARANQEKWAGDNQLEFVGFDNQASPQVSLVQLKNAIDQGFRYITQANGSGAALALIDAINKHNERNPGKEVMFLNHGAVDPSLTNDKCSFWHFRFDANADMKSQALVSHIAANPAIKKIYIINQDYAAGHQFTRGVKEYLKSSRGDLNVFHRLSVYENLRCSVLWSLGYRYSFWQRLNDLRDVRERADIVLEQIGLRDRQHTSAGLLTYAEQRALEIGIAIASDAAVILLDEPTAGMSRSETDAAVEMIRRITKGKTLLVVEHDMSVVFALADKIAVLVYGEIIASGAPNDIRNNPRVQEAYLGGHSTADHIE